MLGQRHSDGTTPQSQLCCYSQPGQTTDGVIHRVSSDRFGLQMEIFDAYVEDLIRQDKAKDKKGVKTGSAPDEDKKKGLQSDFQTDDIGRVSRAAKVMERMVNQNTFDDIAQGTFLLLSPS